MHPRAAHQLANLVAFYRIDDAAHSFIERLERLREATDDPYAPLLFPELIAAAESVCEQWDEIETEIPAVPLLLANFRS